MIRTIALLVLGATLPGAMTGQEPMFRRVLRMGPAEQEVVIREALDRGFPTGAESTDAVVTLIRSNPDLSIPLIERKVEEALSAPDPQSLFSVPGVDRDRFVGMAAEGMIAYAGNREALEAIAKLVRIDRTRFSRLVSQALYSALTFGNPYVVVYQGYGLGDPDLDPLIAAWTAKVLTGPSARYVQHRDWAEVLIYRCKGIPTEGQWLIDPIANHLTVEVGATIHDSVMAAATEIAATMKAAVSDPPLDGVLQITEAEQTEFASSYIDRGMPPGVSATTFADLVSHRSSIVIPMIERKIENVLSSTSSAGLFSKESIDPTIFAARAGSMIAHAGNIEAIRAVTSLIRINRSRFAHLAVETFGNALRMGLNPMSLGYEALALDDRDLDPLVVNWASSALDSVCCCADGCPMDVGPDHQPITRGASACSPRKGCGARIRDME